MIGYEDVGAVLRGAHQADEFESIQRLHRPITKHQIARNHAHLAKALGRVHSGKHVANTEPTQYFGDQRQHMTIIIDYENVKPFEIVSSQCVTFEILGTAIRRLRAPMPLLAREPRPIRLVYVANWLALNFA